MIFLATLISLLVERFFHWTHLRHWRWFSNYQNWLNTKIANRHPALLLAAYVLPIAFLIGVISSILCGKAYGIFHLAFGTAVLLYCLGPNNLWEDAYNCVVELSKGNSQPAIEFARRTFGSSLSQSSQGFHQTFLHAIFIAANTRVFAVIFWFALLGPMGAFLYRAVELCAHANGSSTTDLALKTQKVLDWIPARVLTFLFALTGHFSKVFTCWVAVAKQGLNSSNAVISDCGIAALDSVHNGIIPEDGTAEKEALMLFDRALILTLVILAVVTLLML